MGYICTGITKIKTKTCLFIGVNASDYSRKLDTELNIHRKGAFRDKKINDTFPRKAVINDQDGIDKQPIFMKHTSQFFTWEKWNKFLGKAILDEIEWLRKKLL
mgnify:CR=1 FL=1